MLAKRIGFLGAGQMAGALARGFVKCKFAQASDIYLTDINAECLKVFAGEGFTTKPTNSEIVENADIIILAVKPNVAEPVLKEIKGAWKSDKVLISIAAGKKLTFFAGILGTAAVVRVMPNLPCLVGESVLAYTPNDHCKEADVEFTSKLLSSVGKAHLVPENLMNAVIGVSGSGVAQFFVMIEAMADAGVAHGLCRPAAIQMAAQSAVGAGKMVLETNQHPAVLKDQVCSPGGTTIRTVAALEDEGFRAAVISGVNAAVDRAEEMDDM
eukprot:GHVO01064861.1.p1 GENE.GHVO01064861.1~~GHVO01064861.1.p1  ORF type:complete len:269 (+),score=43.58 GHVO01064861.1:30-836(+)